MSSFITSDNRAKSSLFSVCTFVLMILSFSCKDESSDNEIVIDQNSNLYRINVFENAKVLNIDSLFKLQQIVTFKVDSPLVMYNADKISLFNDRFFLLDSKASNLFIFDSTGQFEKNVVSIGEGVGEFLNLNDFLIDSLKREILVFSNSDSKIAWFDLQGNFKREKAIDFSARKFNWLTYPKLAFTTNYGYTEGKYIYNCIVTDTSLKSLQKYFKRQDCNTALSLSGFNTPFEENEVLISEPLSDTTYSLINQKSDNRIVATPRFLFNFGERSLPLDARCNFYERHSNSVFKKYDYISKECFYLYPYFFFGMISNGKERWGVFDIEKRETKLNGNFNEDYWSYLKIIPQVQISEERFAVYIPFSTFYDLNEYYPIQFEKFIKSNVNLTKEIKDALLKSESTEDISYLFIFSLKNR